MKEGHDKQREENQPGPQDAEHPQREGDVWNQGGETAQMKIAVVDEERSVPREEGPEEQRER